MNAKQRRVEIKHRKRQAKFRTLRQEQAAANGVVRPPARRGVAETGARAGTARTTAGG